MNIVEKVTVLTRVDGTSDVELVVTGKDDVAHTLVLSGRVSCNVSINSIASSVTVSVTHLGEMQLTDSELSA